MASVNVAAFAPHTDEALANAKLISAAPDLLDILRDLLVWGRAHISPVHDTAAHLLLVRAFEAIAKAEGGAK